MLCYLKPTITLSYVVTLLFFDINMMNNMNLLH